MENIENITPKEYVLDTMDSIKKDISDIKKALCYDKALGVLSASFACYSNNLFKLVDNEWVKLFTPTLWAAFGANFVLGVLMHSNLNSLEVQNDALQEKLDLGTIATKSKGNVNESRKYLVKKVETLDGNLSSYRKFLKLWLLGAGVSFAASMICHDNNLISILGIIASYLLIEKGLDNFFKITRDSHIVDRINITLDLDEVKRARKLNRGVNDGK